MSTARISQVIWRRSARGPDCRLHDGKDGLANRTIAGLPVRQPSDLTVLRGVYWSASRKRRGPVALRPRLSPGAPLSIESIVNVGRRAWRRQCAGGSGSEAPPLLRPYAHRVLVPVIQRGR